jgi:hypothetical protein
MSPSHRLNGGRVEGVMRLPARRMVEDQAAGAGMPTVDVGRAVRTARACADDDRGERRPCAAGRLLPSAAYEPLQRIRRERRVLQPAHARHPEPT